MTRSTVHRIAAIAIVGAVIALAPPVVSSFQVPVVIGSIASVAATPDDSASVQGFLKSYESTLASGRVEEIVKLYVDGDHGRKAELDDYFTTAIKDLVVRLDDVAIEVRGDRAEVSFKRTDSFVDRKSGNKVEKSVLLDRQLQRSGQGWQIALES
jgi:hypothetical protein